MTSSFLKTLPLMAVILGTSFSASAGFQFNGGGQNTLPSATLNRDSGPLMPMPQAEMAPVDSEPLGFEDMAGPGRDMNRDIMGATGLAKGQGFRADNFYKAPMGTSANATRLPPQSPPMGMQTLPERQNLIIRNTPSNDTMTVTSTSSSMPMAETDTWRARKGEPVRDVLARWSERANVNLVWDSGQSATLAQDISTTGSFEDAVNEVIAKSSGADLVRTYSNDALYDRYDPALPPETPATPQYSGGREIYAQDVIEETRWDVATGTSLRGVIEQWSRANGTDVIWNMDKDFTFDNPFFVRGSYEQAVERALDQFDSRRDRPTGTLYTNPQTGLPVLVVENSNG